MAADFLASALASGFFAWLVPTSPRTARAGLLSRRTPGVYLKRLLSSLLAGGKIDVRCLIDHRKTLDQAIEAFALAGRKGTLKVLVQIAGGCSQTA
jgi:hypothetical protein